MAGESRLRSWRSNVILPRRGGCVEQTALPTRLMSTTSSKEAWTKLDRMSRKQRLSLLVKPLSQVWRSPQEIRGRITGHVMHIQAIGVSMRTQLAILGNTQ